MSVHDEVVGLTRALVRLETAGYDEVRAADLLQPRLEAAGLTCARTAFADGRTTLRADLPGDGPRLLLTSHLDVVPVTDGWEHEPFAGDLVDGVLHGRGSVDTKGAVAAMVLAVEQAAATTTGRPLRLLLTAGEEQGCLGAAHHLAAHAGGDVDAVLVGEPTGCEPVVAHKGVQWLRLVARGTAAHASAPHLGSNAVTALARAVAALDDLVLPGSHPLLGTPTSSLGTFHGGTQPNVVPDHAEAVLDVRLVPGCDPEEVRARVAALLGGGVEVHQDLLLPPVASDPGAPFVERVVAAARDAGGRGELGTAAYFTDASVLTPAAGDVPTVVLGPGDPALAHQRDERCPVGQLQRAARVHATLATEWRSGG